MEKIMDSLKKTSQLIVTHLLIYMVVQNGSLCLFATANEYAYDICEIQFCFCFLSHMNTHNTTKNTQMTCCRFVITLNLFWCHG